MTVDEQSELLRNARNSEYIAKITRSTQEVADGLVVKKSMEELEAIADEGLHAAFEGHYEDK